MGKHISKANQMKLIQECRNSGMSDYQWCDKQGIPHSTFYRWIRKLRVDACASIPVKTDQLSSKQDIVKIEVVDEIPVKSVTTVDEPVCLPNSNHAMEIKLKGITINVNNNVDRLLLTDVIKLLGSISC